MKVPRHPGTTYLFDSVREAKAKQACLRKFLAVVSIRASVTVSRKRKSVKVTPRTGPDYRQWAGAEHGAERHCRI